MFNQSSPGSQVDAVLSVPRWSGPGKLPKISAYVHSVNVPTTLVWSADFSEVSVTINEADLATAVSAGSAYTLVYYAEGWGFARKNGYGYYENEKVSVPAELINVSDSAGVLSRMNVMLVAIGHEPNLIPLLLNNWNPDLVFRIGQTKWHKNELNGCLLMSRIHFRSQYVSRVYIGLSTDRRPL